MNFATLLILPVIMAPASEHPSPAEIATRLLEQKFQMPTDYTIKIKIEAKQPTVKPPREREWHSTRQIWKLKDKVRIDHYDAHYVPAREQYIPGSRRVECLNGERQDYFYVTTIVPPDPDRQDYEVSFRDAKNSPLPFDTDAMHFDWRLYGLLSMSGHFFYKSIDVVDAHLRYFEHYGATVRTDTRSGIECLVVEWRTWYYNRTVWLSIADDYHPIYFEELKKWYDPHEWNTQEIQWQRLPGGRIFPKRIKTYRVIRDGDVPHYSEQIVTVLHVDFDKPISPLVFTIAAIGLNEGQAIAYPGVDPMDRPVWHKGKADSSYTVRDYMLDKAKK